MILDNLPVFQVVAPLVIAPLCLLVRSPRIAWLLALTGSIAALFFTLWLIVEVDARGEVVAMLGGWLAPWGIEYRVDSVTVLVLLVISAIGTLALISAPATIEHEIEPGREPLFYTAWLLCMTGLLGIAVTGDAFNLFVFLEISSLSSYVLIAFGRDRRALTAAFQYLVMGTIGATFILVGVGFLYMSTGTLNMVDIAARLPESASPRTVESAFAFMTVGLGLKIAMFPLHLWLPNAYAFAPGAVSTFLAATSTKVAVYAFIRFVYGVFGNEFSFEAMPLSLLLAVLATAAVLIASTVAIFQDNVKRMLAYSSVAQIGYMLFGVALATAAGLSAAMVHLFNHALMKGALFLSVGCIAWRLRQAVRGEMEGLGRRMPWTSAAFLIAALSLIGVPPTAGFVSKWLLISAALEKGWWPVVVVVVAGSLLAVIYIWRVVEVLYRPVDDKAVVSEAPMILLVPTWILVFANLYFGIFTGFGIGVAKRAAGLFFGSG